MQSVGAVFHQACARSRKTGSGTRTKRQPTGSKANASEDALIWHSAGWLNQRALLKEEKWSTLEVNAGE
jgi:hypothetical protein